MEKRVPRGPVAQTRRDFDMSVRGVHTIGRKGAAGAACALTATSLVSHLLSSG